LGVRSRESEDKELTEHIIFFFEIAIGIQIEIDGYCFDPDFDPDFDLDWPNIYKVA
jgi:hypothetical protein